MRMFTSLFGESGNYLEIIILGSGLGIYKLCMQYQNRGQFLPYALLKDTGRIQTVMQHQHLPEADRLSILAATILLAYALANFVRLPIRDLDLQLPGFYLAIQINARTVVAVLVAGLTASGADWLLRTHPSVRGHSTFEHWLVPALTSLVIGVPLSQISGAPQWWLGFFMGGALLMLVLVAEYITIDPEDVRQPIASAGLTTVAFALYLILAIALRYSGARLFLILPALAFAAWLVSLRTLHLRLHGRWMFLQAGVVALVCAQAAAALHYMPLSPVSFGLLLIGPAYALTSLLANLAEGTPLRQAILEPFIVLVILFGAAIWIR
jgi:hypothetical protein